MSRPLSVLLLRLEWRVALVGILAVAILFTGSLWWSGQWRLPGFPPLIELRAKVAPAEPIFLDRFGRVLQELPRKSLAPRLNWLPLGSVSPELVDAIVTFQDRRFYRHYGVDLRAFGGAARDAVQGHVHSAMTITMRTAELLRGRDHEMGGTGLAGFERVAQALLLDAQWKKTEILEAYLNLAPFAPDLIGVDQASRVLFQKESQSLDPREIALLTALLLDSKDNLPRLVSKACHVLRHM